MEQLVNWLVPIVVVVVLGGVTLLFATFIGRWIDAQGNDVIAKPRERRKKSERPK